MSRFLSEPDAASLHHCLQNHRQYFTILGENPSEEVDDYDNYYYLNKSQETTVFGRHQKLTSAVKKKARKVMVDFKFDALYR